MKASLPSALRGTCSFAQFLLSFQEVEAPVSPGRFTKTNPWSRCLWLQAQLFPNLRKVELLLGGQPSLPVLQVSEQ